MRACTPKSRGRAFGAYVLFQCFQLQCFVSAATHGDHQCVALERLEGVRCFGLEALISPGATEADCEATCCADQLCEIWQWHPEQGCFYGTSRICVPDSFGARARGARLRLIRVPRNTIDGIRPSVEAVKQAQLQWRGDRVAFNEYAYIEPYAGGSHKLQLHATDGETYRMRRHRPGLRGFDVAMSCWSPERQPHFCCPRGGVGRVAREDCWGPSAAHQQRCCTEGVTWAGDQLMWFEVYIMISDSMTDDELRAWDSVLPGVNVDRSAYDAKRIRWRVGHNEPGEYCFSVPDSKSPNSTAVGAPPSDLAGLMHILQEERVPLSGTFVDIGAGGCQNPDPIYPLISSPMGARFAGLAVEMNATFLQECVDIAQRLKAHVHPVQTAVDPTTVARDLRPHLESLFGDVMPIWPLDVLVIDIDGSDCSVAEELMQVVRPKLVILEIAFYVPPPFKFQLQHDPERAAALLHDYDVTQLNPLSGCSLSYALHHLRPYGYHLLRLTYQDAIFAHETVAPALERRLGLRLPLDEFECYRRSWLWMQAPAENVREWFFAPHPAASLGLIWSNLTSVNEATQRPEVPFTLDY